MEQKDAVLSSAHPNQNIFNTFWVAPTSCVQRSGAIQTIDREGSAASFTFSYILVRGVSDFQMIYFLSLTQVDSFHECVIGLIVSSGSFHGSPSKFLHSSFLHLDKVSRYKTLFHI